MIKRFFVILFLLLTACQEHGSSVSPPPFEEDSIPPPPDQWISRDGQIMLSWDKDHPERNAWTQFVYNAINGELFTVFDSAEDAEKFCPKYAELTQEQKSWMWSEMIAGLTYYEAGWDPLVRFREANLSGVNNPIDPVTKRPVYSEGLMQLSYQDKLWTPECKMDWEKDKELDPQDPNKTILDVFINLDCGLRIMARVIKQRHKVIVAKNAYWSVLKQGSRRQKINEITRMTKRLSFCH